MKAKSKLLLAKEKGMVNIKELFGLQLQEIEFSKEESAYIKAFTKGHNDISLAKGRVTKSIRIIRYFTRTPQSEQEYVLGIKMLIALIKELESSKKQKEDIKQELLYCYMMLVTIAMGNKKTATKAEYGFAPYLQNSIKYKVAFDNSVAGELLNRAEAIACEDYNVFAMKCAYYTQYAKSEKDKQKAFDYLMKIPDNAELIFDGFVYDFEALGDYFRFEAQEGEKSFAAYTKVYKLIKANGESELFPEIVYELINAYTKGFGVQKDEVKAAELLVELKNYCEQTGIEFKKLPDPDKILKAKK